jgi:hypothetical protein
MELRERTVCYAAATSPAFRSVRLSATPRVVWKRGTEPGLTIAPASHRIDAYTGQTGEGMADGQIAVEQLRFDRECATCHRGNLAVHAFCGWCGKRLPPTVMDPSNTGEITLIASTPCDSAEMTTVDAGRPACEAEVTQSHDTSGAIGLESTVVDADYRNVDGVAVVLLGTPQIGGRSQPRTTYRLELGEPFDVAAPGLQRPATFTATVHGLRFDAIGDLDGVYLRLRGRQEPIAYRRVRVEQELGAFQAVGPGETLPIGSLAIIGNALVRIEAIAS